MYTMIISGFPAIGKTYLYKNQNELSFKNSYGGVKRYSFKDSDSSLYTKELGWEKKYVDDIEKARGEVDFIFISCHEVVLAELQRRGLPFVMVAPDNSEYISDKERQLIKQQWFGRFLLRDSSHIKDFKKWINTLSVNYDSWTSVESLTKYNPASFFLLKENQYLSDIIEDLWWKKEHYPETYWHYKAVPENN